jgi:hypothetical protein
VAQLVVPPARAQDQGHKIEYQCANLVVDAKSEADVVNKLNQNLKRFGDEHWELVTLGNTIGCFKRPL